MESSSKPSQVPSFTSASSQRITENHQFPCTTLGSSESVCKVCIKKKRDCNDRSHRRHNCDFDYYGHCNHASSLCTLYTPRRGLFFTNCVVAFWFFTNCVVPVCFSRTASSRFVFRELRCRVLFFTNCIVAFCFPELRRRVSSCASGHRLGP